MQKLPMPQGQGEKLNGPNSTDTNNKENYPLLERIEIKDTPFVITGNKEIGYKLTWGRFNLTDKMNTEEEVLEWGEKHHWEITMGMVHIYIENYMTMKEQFKTLDKIAPKEGL